MSSAARADRLPAPQERLVIVVGHPDYYPRFGFQPSRPLGLEVPFAVSNEAFMVCDLADDCDRLTMKLPMAWCNIHCRSSRSDAEFWQSPDCMPPRI